MRWARHVERMGAINVHTILIRSLEGRNYSVGLGVEEI
jgi:hypothetical protein